MSAAPMNESKGGMFMRRNKTVIVVLTCPGKPDVHLGRLDPAFWESLTERERNSLIGLRAGFLGLECNCGRHQKEERNK